jgi:hypothetical protein
VGEHADYCADDEHPPQGPGDEALKKRFDLGAAREVLGGSRFDGEEETDPGGEACTDEMLRDCTQWTG